MQNRDKNLRGKESVISLYFERGPFPPQFQTPMSLVLYFIRHELFLPSQLCHSRTPEMGGTCVLSPRHTGCSRCAGKRGILFSQEGALPSPTLA